MDIFVSPSYDPGEGLPLRILEAMSMGLPVIATDVNGVREEVEHGRTGILLAPKSHYALAASIIELLADPDLRRRMGEAGRELYLQRFRAQRMVNETVDSFRQILGEKQ